MTNTDKLRSDIVQALRDAGQPWLAMLMEETAIPMVAQLSYEGDAILYDNEWLQLRETSDGYVYAHENKSNGRGVAVLAYRRVGDELQIAGRFERCPCHRDGFALTSLTGQIEGDDEPITTAVRELKEEAGIDAVESEMQTLGTVRPGKQTDTIMHLFAIDVGDRDIGEALGDGTAGEQGAYCAWVTLTDAALSKSPVLAALLLRSFFSFDL